MDTKRFTNSELSSFCGQLALILRSGISATEGLTVMLDDTTDNTERAILQQILEKQEETGSLYPALACTNLFPAYLLPDGEDRRGNRHAGRGDAGLERPLCPGGRHHAQHRSAVAYPAVMAGMMIAVIIVLLVKVMPIFNQVFIQLGTEMTGISRGLMNVGTVLNRYSMFFLALLVLAPCGWPDPLPFRQRPQLFLRNALSFPPFPARCGMRSAPAGSQAPWD